MKICIFTLGCKLNEVESDSILGGLAARGHEVTQKLGYADLYLLNTCAVTAEAEKKSRQAVARMRKFNPTAPLVVFGCAAEHAPADFGSREGVTCVLGAVRKDRVLAAVDEILRGDVPMFASEQETAFCELPAPHRSRTRAYLRVQDGCDRFCSYCIIPYLRGRSRSRGTESILREAMSCGAREIVLTGVDLSSWREGERMLGDLLLSLGSVPARIRLGSLEVSAVTEQFLEAIRTAGNVCPHFHLSLQSGSDAVLRKMNRKYTRASYLEACNKIYAAFPHAAITTDIIVGFPTETEEDFADSLSIVEEAAFARIHAFPFSAREGTPAARMRLLEPEVVKSRMARMLSEARKAEERFFARALGSRGVALFEEDGGYTENYLRVYNDTAEDGGMYEVCLTERYRDGARCTLLKKL